MITLPYGSWPSPLSARWASEASPRFEGAALASDEVWWGQSLPAEAGRTAVLRRTASGQVETLLPAPWSARSRVHEYGGGAWTATDDGRLLFVEKTDQRVWLLDPGHAPRALTAEEPGTSYGGLRWQHGALLAVQERQSEHGWHRAIVRIEVSAGEASVTELVSGSDFVAQPALSPDGTWLAWVAWNHPDMPWDRTEIRVGEITDGTVSSWDAVTSGAAALQPEWTAGGDLVVIDEPTGRWNLWRVGADAAEPLAPADADTGGGLWSLGLRWYALLGDRIAAIRTNGSDELVIIEPDGRTQPVDLPATSRLVIEDADADRLLVTGAGPAGAGLWLVTADGAVTPVVGGAGMDAGWMPTGRAVTFAGPHGDVHAFDYPPTNPDVTGPDGELPPYVVFVHGGPTAHVAGVADARTAFLTSRGIGVLDVNYGGSTGYGRAYRERLRGQWGVVDVDDVAAAASGLVAAGLADGARLAIDGGSAGGWTVLGALVGTDVFAAGISRYGVGDARALAEDTHDFEAHYLDGLIGPLPEADALYRERSPLSHPERFRVPLLLLQGAEDAVVPPAQSEAIRDALAAHGVPHAYVLYEGEGHGFRRAETVVHARESELAFLGAVFGFETPGIPPITLD
ncbi:MAG: peptidase S9 [Microbacterium sp. SCN 70-200]|uniref:S9 family peptidase n=1 Tax=unclassified Microbacterium TaxID=2609290 RepID=UPI00086CBE1C|nr:MULTISPECIES: prolyl oligopeptidase family serine peptidase [unclassified Microbacterium]MBN9214063.1 S9 family peptidase [Microbacterium sp.]ODT39741.1 MAG: peptidase S9 [Microbacterium sp. SCN 70-200]OJV82818.1 MAG: S9 family peptidase [Microbacterium sp. 70-16]